MRTLLVLSGWLMCAAIAAAQTTTNLPARDVTFTATNDGSAQKYVLVLPPDFKADAPHDVLIALHGHGADRWQFVKHAFAEGRAARDVAAKHRMILVSPDYRAKTSWMGPKAEADVLQIIGEVKKNHRVARVFLCGASMGGSASLTFAVLHPDLLAGVAAMNGTANLLTFQGFSGAISESFGGDRMQIPNEYKKRSAEYWPQKLTMPIGLTTSGKDKVVPAESVQRLASELEELKRKVHHIHRPETGHETSYEDATAILEFVIREAKSQK